MTEDITAGGGMKKRTQRVVTGEQLKAGWIEMQGATPVHHNYVVLREVKGAHDGGRTVYVVKEPEIRELPPKKRTPRTEAI